MTGKRNAVFWKNGRYRAVITEGVYTPYLPRHLFTTDRTVTVDSDYPTKEQVLESQPHLADYEQVEME